MSGNPRAHGHIKYILIGLFGLERLLAFRRFEDRENALVKHLGLDLSKPFNLINKSCGTPPRCEYRENIKPDNDYLNVYMDAIEDFLYLIGAKFLNTLKRSILWRLVYGCVGQVGFE